MTNIHETDVIKFESDKSFMGNLDYLKVLHLMDIHGPFPVEVYVGMDVVTKSKCISCNSAWPCATYRIITE